MQLLEQINRIQEMMGLMPIIINEGRYSEPVRQITKDVMDEIMPFLESNKSKIKWMGYYAQEEFDVENEEFYEEEDEDEENEEENITTFQVKLIAKKNNSELPYDIDAAQDWNSNESVNVIELDIKINPDKFSDKIINKFQAELKDTIRHEIEHLYQSENPYKNLKEIPTSTFADEVLTPKELNAYIQGFYTQAKTRKMFMDDVIDEWSDERKNQFSSTDEKEFVKQELTKFGKKLLPQAKWR